MNTTWKKTALAMLMGVFATSVFATQCPYGAHTGCSKQTSIASCCCNTQCDCNACCKNHCGHKARCKDNKKCTKSDMKSKASTVKD